MTEHVYSEEQATLYALDLLERDGAVAFAEHLASCAQCRVMYAEHLALQDVLLESVPQAEPPSSMDAGFRRKLADEPARGEAKVERLSHIPSRVTRERRLAPRIPAWAAAALIILSLGTGTLGYLQWQARAELRVAKNPQIQVIPMAATAELPKASGQVVMVHMADGGGSMKMEVAGLTPLRGTEVYQLWIIKDGLPIDAGVLSVDASGRAVAAGPLHMEGPFQAFTITREPDGPGKAPRGKIVLQGPVS